MPALDQLASDAESPEFASIRGELARLFVEHTRDLALDDWSDALVIAEVDKIASTLMACGTIALQRGDAEWLERHRWFSEACERLFAAQPAARLDA